MLWLSAEKQTSIFFEFFNRIDPMRTFANLSQSIPESDTQWVVTPTSSPSTTLVVQRY